MGEYEGWAQPSGLLPNGLLPNSSPLIRVLDSERWLKAEERTADIISCIQPNPPSEERRNAVANYVQRLITKCFSCQVFTFGSVPLKTYLPDGDIDLTTFSNNQNLKDTWANQVRDMLENEEKNENAEFHVKEVQYIQAEVKIVKCLVENIVVDISFNQLGGLCTLCFLEEIDHLINQNHLFKRSIILIKAWCYYESRILGAHHGLISTYALETLVLYIFHVFNKSFAGPLEVLYRFLEFFSNFDWENFCVSLWGPVPISSLPDVMAEPPRKDSGELLLSKVFLDSCSTAYAVFPGGQENQGQPFVSKHFNVIDPLRINNNLGRSVSKGNFFRIRSAFAFGAKRLARLLECPGENVVFEVNQFFTNTWDRHGGGQRPDIPMTDLRCLRLSTPAHVTDSENLKNKASNEKMNCDSYGREPDFGRAHSNSFSSRDGNHPSENMIRTNDVSSASHVQSENKYRNLNSLRMSDHRGGEVSSNQVVHADKSQRIHKSDQLVNETHGRFLFTRTRSSPELTDMYSDFSSRGRQNRPPESGKNQVPIRKNLGFEISAGQSGQSSTDEPLAVGQVPSHQSLDASIDLKSGSNAYHRDSGLGEELSSVIGAQGMHQEEQDLVNLMANSTIHSFNGQVHMPLNLASGHLPFPISPSLLASMGYVQRNFTGMGPTNIPVIDPSFSNMHFPPHGLVPHQLAHYFPGIGLTPNSEYSVETGDENYGSSEMNSGEAESEVWHDQDVDPTVSVDPENGNFENLQSEQQSTSGASDFVPSHQISRSSSSLKFAKESRWPIREDHLDSRDNEVYADERTASSRFSSSPRSSYVRSKTSSESSWDGSSAKFSKPTREKRGKGIYGKGRGMSEHASTQAEEEDRDWDYQLNMGTGIAERSSGPQSLDSLQVTSGSDSMIPTAPMMVGPGSQQRAMDNSGVPFAFYPTGPPVPFLTMLPVYDTGNSEASTSRRFGGEEGLDNSDSGRNLDSRNGLGQFEDFNFLMPDEHKSDILNSDFASHWQNLQFGRYCQSPRHHGPFVYPSPSMVPPVYLQGNSGRPMSPNMNLFSQLVSYGPRLVPVAPLQSVPNRPPGVYQRYVYDMPRHRSGTGTYLPNPKVSVRDRHSSGTRRGSFNYDRNDNHSDREGNWNSKPRPTGRSHGRTQTERSNSRSDRLAATESQADRSWRHDSIPSYQSQNGPLRSNPSQSGIPNMAYGMYPLPAMNVNGVSSNGPTVPSVIMLYPFDHNGSYGSSSEQLEFGSLGPVVFSGMNEQTQPSEGGQERAFEDHRYDGGSVQRSSPDPPSSPHLERLAQRNSRSKDDD